VYVCKEKAAENRDALLRTASRLFRAHGIDGVGVAQIAKEAGLTHGAVYAHFASKEALAAAALSYGFAGNMLQTREWIGDRLPTFEDLVGVYTSPKNLSRLDAGCPMAASACEVARKTCEVSESFSCAFNELAALLEATLESSIPVPDRRRLAIAAAAAEIGALAVARAVTKANAALADEILEATRETLAAAHHMASSERGEPAL
jgi:TetR/AcrR family transcriptional repressor of nem operon